MLKNRLIYKTKPGSYVNDYDPTIDPSVLNAHATAAFRYFHSQIEGRLEYVKYFVYLKTRANEVFLIPNCFFSV